MDQENTIVITPLTSSYANTPNHASTPLDSSDSKTSACSRSIVDPSSQIKSSSGNESNIQKQTGPESDRISRIAQDPLHLDPIPLKTVGTKTLSNGKFYEGELQNDLPHGQGKLTWIDVQTYEGQFENGKFHGHGKLTWPNGNMEGEFENDELHGKGVTILANGNRYEGQFEKGELHGQGMMIENGDLYEGEFIYGKLKSNLSHLKDLWFLKLLIGSNENYANETHPLGVISDYLEQRGYPEAEALKSAHQMNLSFEKETEKNSKLIYQKLTEPTAGKGERSQLITYGMLGHAMLLNLVLYTSDQGEKFIDFEIFNSGEGLYNHKYEEVESPLKNKTSEKFQTMLRFRMPIANFNQNIIKNLLDHKFYSANEAYEAIKNLQGCIPVLLDKKSTVLQTAQKGNNCTSECLFAYLKNKMTKDVHSTVYNEMRLHLFEECLEAATNNPKIDSEDRKKIIIELERKIENRKEKIAELLTRASNR